MSELENAVRRVFRQEASKILRAVADALDELDENEGEIQDLFDLRGGEIKKSHARVRAANANGAGDDEDQFVCDCGKSYTQQGWYDKHIAKCEIVHA